MPILANFANLPLVPGAVLLLPTAATLWFRWAALRAEEARQRAIWAGFRRFGRFILTAIVSIWWALWDLAGKSLSSVESWRFLVAARCELRYFSAPVFRSR
jgi:hypothetical protein